MDLEETRAFLAVLDHGSFKSAADEVRLPRATLRRRVEALEVRAGVALLERSRNGVVATAAGELLARQARVMLREANALLAALREVDGEPSGELRIGASPVFPPRVMATLLGELRDAFPRLQPHLQVCSDLLEGLEDQLEIAVLLGPGEPPGRWRSSELCELREGLKASRSYLQRRGVPHSIDDLGQHELLAQRAPDDSAMFWPSLRGGSFAIEPSLTTSDPRSLRQLVNLGFGIGLLPDDDDELIPVLDGVVGCRRSLRIAVPDVLADTPKIRAVTHHLQRALAAFGPRSGAIELGASLRQLQAV